MPVCEFCGRPTNKKEEQGAVFKAIGYLFGVLVLAIIGAVLLLALLLIANKVGQVATK